MTLAVFLKVVQQEGLQNTRLKLMPIGKFSKQLSTECLFSRSVVSDSLWLHRLQHTRLPCPTLSPGVCSNSCPLSQWCRPAISSSVAPSSPARNRSYHQGLFQWVISSHQVAKYWSFRIKISHSNEYSGLSSFRIYQFDHLAFQGILKSLLQHDSWKASILWC